MYNLFTYTYQFFNIPVHFTREQLLSFAHVTSSNAHCISVRVCDKMFGFNTVGVLLRNAPRISKDRKFHILSLGELDFCNSSLKWNNLPYSDVWEIPFADFHNRLVPQPASSTDFALVPFLLIVQTAVVRSRLVNAVHSFSVSQHLVVIGSHRIQMGDVVDQLVAIHFPLEALQVPLFDGLDLEIHLEVDLEFNSLGRAGIHNSEVAIERPFSQSYPAKVNSFFCCLQDRTDSSKSNLHFSHSYFIGRYVLPTCKKEEKMHPILISSKDHLSLEVLP